MKIMIAGPSNVGYKKPLGSLQQTSVETRKQDEKHRTATCSISVKHRSRGDQGRTVHI